MSYPAKTLFVFGCYLVALGAVLVVIPNALLAVFGIPTTGEVWIRAVGMLLLFLGVLYVLAARAELTPFFRWTVPIRASVIVFFAAFVLLRLAPPVLLLFSVIDLASAIWTRTALARGTAAGA